MLRAGERLVSKQNRSSEKLIHKPRHFVSFFAILLLHAKKMCELKTILAVGKQKLNRTLRGDTSAHPSLPVSFELIFHFDIKLRCRWER